MKNLSILIYSLGSGGAERVLSLLLPTFTKHYRVHLVLMADIIHYKIPKEVEVTFLEESKVDENQILKLLKLPILGYKYKKFCEENKIDISFSFMNRPNYINVFSKIFGGKAKTVISERAMPSLEYGGGGFKSIINRVLIKKLYPKADKIIANSEANKKDLTDNFNIEKEKIKRIYNPIDIDFVDIHKMEKVDFDFSRFTYITIGRLDEGKNHKMMINAFSKIIDKDSQLVIIGYGELEGKLSRYIDYLGLASRVFLVGRQENPYKWLYRSDCFLFTSLHEGFPNVILEALACELFIISTNPNGVVEEIVGREYGVLVKDEQELTKAMENIKKPKNQRKRAEEFSLDVIAPLFLQELHS